MLHPVIPDSILSFRDDGEAGGPGIQTHLTRSPLHSWVRVLRTRPE